MAGRLTSGHSWKPVQMQGIFPLPRSWPHLLSSRIPPIRLRLPELYGASVQDGQAQDRIQPHQQCARAVSTKKARPLQDATCFAGRTPAPKLIVFEAFVLRLTSDRRLDRHRTKRLLRNRPTEGFLQNVLLIFLTAISDHCVFSFPTKLQPQSLRRPTWNDRQSEESTRIVLGRAFASTPL